MEPRSNSYRNDEVGPVPEDIKAKLDELFWQKRPNLEKINPKILVIFSGTNGVGKSTIASKIEKELNGLVIENDEVKRILIKLYPDLSKEERGLLIWNYTMGLYSEISNITGNGLIVRDGIIDWYFDRILPLFEKQGFTIFTIAFSVSREKNEQLIIERGDTATVKSEFLVNQINVHQDHIKRFRSTYTPDIILTDENLFDHDLVIETLRQKINQITQTT